MKKLICAFLAVFVLLGLSSCLVNSYAGSEVSLESESFYDSSFTESAVNGDKSSFYITFIDVGQADAALIMCDGRYMLIDGGNVEDSSRIYSILKARGVSTLDYVIGTHAHEDHIGGLPAAFNACKVKEVFCPVTEYDTKAFNSFKSAAAKQGLDLVLPKVNSKYSLGNSTFTVLAPVAEYEDTNNTSIVVKLVYGDTSFLFTADAEHDSEQAMLDAGYDLSADLLKIGHHGSSTSTSYGFLRAVMPTYAVISVGKDNDYGHPHDEVMSRLKDADVTVLRTDELGDITCHSDGQNISFENNAQPNESTSESVAAYVYIGNVNSKVLHRTTCASLPAERNREYFYTEEEAKSAGYTKKCGNCSP